MKQLFYSLGLSLLCLFPLASFSQTPTFSDPTVPDQLIGNIHGDVNNDGYEDLIGYTANTISVLLSNGDGTYRAPITYPVSNGVYPELLSDFNGDGKLDLVTVNDTADANGNTGFSLYLGNGDGTFGPPATHVIPGQVVTTVAADVNHDNIPDLLVDSSTDGGNTYDVHVLFGNGDGTFSPGPTTYNTNAGAGILAGDFNGDGMVDIAAKNGSEGYGYLGILLGDDSGNFKQSYSDSVGYNVLYVAADVNGDGIMDIIGTSMVYSTNAMMQQPYLTVYYGNSDGTMTPAQTSTQICGVGNVAVADFNGDHIPDIALVGTGCSYSTDTSTMVTVLLGKGNNQFSSGTQVYSTPDSLESFYALRGNRDTKPDLVFSHSNTNTNAYSITTLLNQTSGNFPTCAAPNAATGITLCSPAPGSTVTSPVNFSIGAAGDTKMRKVEVWVDGNKDAQQLTGAFSHYSFLDASIPLSAGSHNVTVYSAGWDNSLQSKSSTVDVAGPSSCSTPSSPGVLVCNPTSGSSNASPFNVQAASMVIGTIARMEVWVDGAKKYTSTTTALNTSLPLAAGSHRFDFYAVNTAGQKWETTVYSTVQ